MKLIAAADECGGIGKKGSLLVHIPEDMRRFKELTVGNTVIMGRKTFESLPGIKPLPDRRNIVLTNQSGYIAAGAITCRGLNAMHKELENVFGDVFVIGGGEIYRILLPLCDTVYITRIKGDLGADVVMPELGESLHITECSQYMEYNGIFYRFETYRRNLTYPSCLLSKAR